MVIDELSFYYSDKKCLCGRKDCKDNCIEEVLHYNKLVINTIHDLMIKEYLENYRVVSEKFQLFDKELNRKSLFKVINHNSFKKLKFQKFFGSFYSQNTFSIVVDKKFHCIFKDKWKTGDKSKEFDLHLTFFKRVRNYYKENRRFQLKIWKRRQRTVWEFIGVERVRFMRNERVRII